MFGVTGVWPIVGHQPRILGQSRVPKRRLTMLNKFWWKGALLLTAGTVLSLGAGGGCLSAVIQRILVAAVFD